MQSQEKKISTPIFPNSLFSHAAYIIITSTTFLTHSYIVSQNLHPKPISSSRPKTTTSTITLSLVLHFCDSRKGAIYARSLFFQILFEIPHAMVLLSSPILG
jgi:hypothetical protein